RTKRNRELRELWRQRARGGEVGPGLRRLGACKADPDLVKLAQDCLAAEARLRPADDAAVAGRIARHRAEVQRRAEDARVQREKREEAEKRARAQVSAKRWALAVAMALGAGGAAAYFNHLAGENSRLATDEQAARGLVEKNRQSAEERFRLASVA